MGPLHSCLTASSIRSLQMRLSAIPKSAWARISLNSSERSQHASSRPTFFWMARTWSMSMSTLSSQPFEGATETERLREDLLDRLDLPASDGALKDAAGGVGSAEVAAVAFGSSPVAAVLVRDLDVVFRFSPSCLLCSAVVISSWMPSAAKASSFFRRRSIPLTRARAVHCSFRIGRMGSTSDLVALRSLSRVSCVVLRREDFPCFSNTISKSFPHCTTVRDSTAASRSLT
mmetsp:Transcript_19516/g.40720  ORF Transcript_19516/g.40720 Transcript_19516/m.40720 type:complete len:231 (+) Transcript_19516:3492-4184(+)